MIADLTLAFRAGFPVDGFDPPRRTPVAELERDGFRCNAWSLVEHTGTHVDAPSHFSSSGPTVSDIPAPDLMVPMAVLDIAHRVATEPGAMVGLADVESYERAHGRLPDRAAVFMRSGWDDRAGDGTSYHGLTSSGGRMFPGFAVETVEWLLEHRSVTWIGVDSPSIDAGQADGFPVHHRWLGAGRYAVEGLARLSTAPPAGATVFIGVVPFEDGTGGPCRVLATW